ncbi:S8 family peptidase [Qipengyuania sp. 6B39]|uniref:S8 family peptidase n=1 Tax=Qipengyuania proteolytica TaxID=2867239 RepID=UPI001C8991C3|nr:S8 family peptidase [Qipengyuania proteolytica]MBX7495161.1 S8 family peptidase [Qipengyuania proteolytica]
MPRNLSHFLLKNLGNPHPFQAKRGGGGRAPTDVLDRAGHAQALLQAIDALPAITAENPAGVYLEVESRPNERLAKGSLDASGLELLRYSSAADNNDNTETATVFASPKGLASLRKKVEQFQYEDTKPREKDGEIIPGRPKNANLVQSLGAIAEAGLRALWRGPQAKFPGDDETAHWEVWLDPESADPFITGAAEFGVDFGTDRLTFPEDTVAVARATRENLALAVRRLRGVRALAAPATTADFFDGLGVAEQAEWVDEMQERTTYAENADIGYVTLLDTGVSRAHPLIAPALDAADRHAAQPAWAVDDVKGHGTQLAGLVLYGDLTTPLQSAHPIAVTHRLESVKLLPDAGLNPHHLLGAVTRQAVNAAEVTQRRRTFTMAVTTDEDTPHDGAPTSWSTEVDQLAVGVSGNRNGQRLFLVSAGNTDNNKFGAGNYLDHCDHEDHEIESPAQAWNALCIGAYTEKTLLPEGSGLTAIAPGGDLSPSSRTASWTSTWPLKPDVVLEGGNWVACNPPPPMQHGWLSLLSTHHSYPVRSFCFTHDTSAATALAAKQVTELWSDYPTLWPETVRGLYVASARWTPQMLSHLPANPNKGDYARLFRRYGYGVPNLERARRSAANALTLVVEDEIVPYGLSEKTGHDVHKEMRLFELPWPVEELRRLGTALVTLRVTLSSFIAPNPSEASRGSRYGYASHNLRFKLNRANENAQQFMARISKAIDADGPLFEEEDMWEFGSNRRDVGSLHIDQLTCPASDLARRNLIAVHPVAGWWKSKARLKEGLPTVRFSLLVEIDAEELEAELYAEVYAAVEAMAATSINI